MGAVTVQVFETRIVTYYVSIFYEVYGTSEQTIYQGNYLVSMFLTAVKNLFCFKIQFRNEALHDNFQLQIQSNYVDDLSFSVSRETPSEPRR